MSKTVSKICYLIFEFRICGFAALGSKGLKFVRVLAPFFDHERMKARKILVLKTIILRVEINETS